MQEDSGERWELREVKKWWTHGKNWEKSKEMLVLRCRSPSFGLEDLITL